MTDGTFASDPEDVFGIGDVILTSYRVWAGEWYCEPWTNKPARITMGYVCKHRLATKPDEYVYLMPGEESGMMHVLWGPHGDPTRDNLVQSIQLGDWFAL